MIDFTIQKACILLLFNTKEELTAEEIQKTLTLPFDDIRKNLLSLTLSKTAKILNKTGSSKNVQPTDTFTVNADFSSKNRRIKIPNLILKISSEERADVDKATKEDRKHAIEAAVVRIMKARKTMTHANLVEEVIKQLSNHFKPDQKVIKRRIEDLITREYLERDDHNASVYKYLA